MGPRCHQGFQKPSCVFAQPTIWPRFFGGTWLGRQALRQLSKDFSKCDYFNACGRTPASAEHESKTMRILLTPMTETEANGPMTWSMLPKNYMFNVALRPQDCQFNLVSRKFTFFKLVNFIFFEIVISNFFFDAGRTSSSSCGSLG